MDKAIGMRNPRLGALTLLIFAAAATRLMPHPPNMTSVAALSLFGGAYFARRWLAFAVPLLALLASDLVLGLYPHMAVQYLSFAVIICIGFGLQRRRSPLPIAAAVILSSMTFFALTNLGVWLFDGLYPKTLSGLAACYIAALPFLRNTLFGDALYTAILFGGFHLLERRFETLRDRPPALGSARAAPLASR
jgi:hypothetical protein